MKLLQLFLMSSILVSLPQLVNAAEPVWKNRDMSPEIRAHALVQAMTQQEKMQLIVSEFARGSKIPAGAVGSAAYVSGIKRLDIPAQQITDAGLGVVGMGDMQEKHSATSLPSGQSISGAFDPEMAAEAGAMIGREAFHRGFNVLLGGGNVLVRNPFNGRNFEYLGEDPLLSGTISAAEVRGTQSQHVLSTIKHYAFNAIETNRLKVDMQIDEQAGRESDLLANEIAVKQGEPASIMCAYNKVNGIYSCENSYLLQLPKKYWGFTGYVMTDWGAGHSTVQAANAGLDQESAAALLDKEVYFGQPLEKAIKQGQVSEKRLDDMAYRIVYSLIRVGAYDYPAYPSSKAENVALHEAISQKVEEGGAVLLKNEKNVLPLSADLKNIAIIGGHADKGVLAGGGSSQVTPRGGNAVPGLTSDNSGAATDALSMAIVYNPSSPMKYIQEQTKAKLQYAEGDNIQVAVDLAKKSDMAIVFVTKWSAESFDTPDLSLPNNQDQLIEAVAATGKPVVVVLETGNPVVMPWLQNVQGVMQAWYPGTSGGKAIANLLTGKVNPSGRLTVTWPKSVDQLAYPGIKGAGKVVNSNPAASESSVCAEETVLSSLDLNKDGADVGYRWFEKTNQIPLFPFGYGLSYTTFKYSHFDVTKEFYDHQHNLKAHVSVTNTGDRDGANVVQVYVQLPDRSPKRLVGFAKIFLKAGETKDISFNLSVTAMAHYNTQHHNWDVNAGTYQFYVTSNALATDGLQQSVKFGSFFLAD